MNHSPPAPMVHISLFSGIGGFEIAAVQIGWTNAASCEINDFGHKILSFHFPNAYHHRDVKTLTYQILNEELTKRFGPNWRSNGIILSGGFPCQGFSVAGNRLGTDDDRYLWPEYLRLIDEINPDWVCGENVTGILTMEDKSGIYRDVFAKVENRKITRLYPVDYYEAIYTRQAKMLVGSICEDLEKRGYEVQPFAIPAASVEAPHKRERIWFIANRGCILGDRGQSEQSGYGIGYGSASERKEKANEPKRQYSPWPDTETQSEWRDLAYLFASPGDNFPTDTNSHDASGSRYGQAGQTPRIGKVVKKERKRLRTVIERIGDKESITNSNEVNWRSESQGRSETSGTRGQFKGSIKKSVADPVGNRGGKSMGGKQSELPNQNGKTKGINPDSRESGLPSTKQKKFTGKNRIAERGTIEQLYTTQNGDRKRFNNFPTQSPVCGGDDGLPSELDGITFSKWRNESIKGFGNAVVPQVVFEIFSAIEKYRIFESSS